MKTKIKYCVTLIMSLNEFYIIIQCCDFEGEQLFYRLNLNTTCTEMEPLMVERTL